LIFSASLPNYEITALNGEQTEVGVLLNDRITTVQIMTVVILRHKKLFL
jgi:hypothetical protein